jgi:hypothetical protein
MAEAILWANKAVRTQRAQKWNQDTQQLEPVINPETGEPVMEKIPQRAHDGDSDPRKPVMVHATWIHYLRHDGHCTRVKITNAAADLDTDQLNGKYHRAKARHYGWIPLSACPCAMRVAGQIAAAQLRSEEARTGSPCAPGTHSEMRPCPHVLAEEAARKEARRRIQAARDVAFEPEAQKLLKGQQQQTTEIVTGVANALADAVRSLAPRPEPIEPETKEPKGRR